jgi:glyoxylase-like metal-dependent hydrolase (beta-lactamase superfamily II)
MDIRTITHKHANIYLIGESGSYVLFDCGWQDSFNVIKAALREYGVSFEQIIGVFVSHFQPDHAGTVELLRRHGVRPLVLDKQAPHIEWLNDFFTISKNDPIGDYSPLNPNVIEPLTLESAAELLKVNGIDGEILYTPGHSEDSISLIVGDSAFIGDLSPHDPLWPNDAFHERGVKIIYAGHYVSQIGN